MNLNAVTDSTLDAEAIEWVNGLFTVLEQHIKYFRLNKLSNQASHDASKREWAKTFMANRLTKEKILRGINKIRCAENPMNDLTASEFIQLCRATPSDIGASDVHWAYREACRIANGAGKEVSFTHPAVRFAFHEVGSYTLRTENPLKTQPLFEKAYLQACDWFADGTLVDRLQSNDNTPKDKGSHQIGQHDFVRPGILRQYEGVSSCEEFVAISEKLLGKGNASLRRVVNQLEVRYAQNG